MKLAPSKKQLGWLLGLGVSLWTLAFAQPATPSPSLPPTLPVAVPAPDANVIPELQVGKDVYYDVHIKQVTPTSIFITHRHGIGSIPLAELPPDLQKRFGYDPAKVAAEEARRQEEIAVHKKEADTAPGDKGPPVLDAQEIIQRFGQPPKVYAEVNMLPRFEELGIGAKDQGVRPSCAIFALVGALEYQMAPVGRQAPDYSEEYLIWATLKSLGKNVLAVPTEQSATLDMGFSLNEVSEAFHAYGIALSDELPYHFILSDPHIMEPAPDVIERAKKRNAIGGYLILGREPKVQIPNIIQVINAGVPVVIGMKWPEEKTVLETAQFDDQPGRDEFSHAVLLVGYRCKTGKIEDAEFFFRNSYGERWGDHGYGMVTYRYLINNLQSALFLDAH